MKTQSCIALENIGTVTRKTENCNEAYDTVEYLSTNMQIFKNAKILIALIRDDVTKISLNVEPRLGGDHFAWFVDV